MALYEYECIKCHLIFEEFRFMSDENFQNSVCPLPNCKSNAKKIISKFSLGTENFDNKTVDVTIGKHAEKSREFFENRKHKRVENKIGRYIYKNRDCIGG
ncbi:MAG: zinc ribbon domain-containing protein [Acidithiobacillus sp.]|jgi:putative FmdB family regulatory protein|uniref:FmdB family zinc ribbon protein n=1 Tax=Acidithiobacillus sp. TaxID=1872118 RepID=UPI00355DDDA5